MAEVWQATITDGQGNIIPRAVVQVRDEATGELAEIFADVDGDIPQRNPFFADDVGFARFYAESGLYRIRAVRGSQQRVFENVLLGAAVADYYVWQHQCSDNEGDALSFASVEIRDADTNALATLYADEDGAVSLGNPFTADSDGVARCYVASGVYKITVSRGVTFEQIYEDVVIGPAPTRDLYAWQSRIVDEEGNVQAGASVLVTDEAGDPATIYADEDETPLDNPLATDASGFARFYAERGVYDIRARMCCAQRVLRDVRLGGDPDPFYLTVEDGTATGSRGMYSSDGKVWTGFDIPAARQWTGMAFSPALHLWVAVGWAPTNQGSVMTSPDGINWTLGSIPAVNGGWRDVVWVDDLGLFVAVALGDGSATEVIATSPDGVNWMKRDVGIAMRGRGIFYKFGYLIAHGIGGIWSSNDFSTWVWAQRVGVGGVEFLGHTDNDSAAFVGARSSNFGIYRTTDGVSFATYASGASQSWNDLSNIAVNDDGLIVRSTADANILTADDIPPTSWTETFDPSLPNHVHSLRWLPKHKIFVYLGRSLIGAWSADGTTWTPITLPEAGEWQAFGIGQV